MVYPSQGHEMLFDAHARSFAALGGVARRGIDDNMKAAVDKVKNGKGRVEKELPWRPRCNDTARYDSLRAASHVQEADHA